MVVIFIVSVLVTHVIFDNIYLTCFLSLGVLFLGYMGFVTYSRDQERRALEKISSRLQAMSDEIATGKSRAGRKNG